MSPRILLLAGEASGDQHGAHLVVALGRRFPTARFFGLGGPRMQAAGVECWAGLDRLAVMGFVEVLRHLRFFRSLERRIVRALDDGVDLVVPIDYPGLNLRITRAAHRRGIPVLYYIAPQVWAWKPGRAERLAREATGVAVILPFEREVFEAVGAEVRFVGHPLLEEPMPDESRAAFCEAHGLDAERPILALFPGSRAQELRRHAALFREVSDRVRASRPGVQTGLAVAPGVEPGALDLGGDVVPVRDSRALLRHSRAAVVKSGTSTLEAAIQGVPFVTVYRTHPLTYRLARRLVTLDHIALANLVAGERIVPELIQGAAAPDSVTAAVLPLLDDGDERARMVEGLSRIREALGAPGASEAVAEWAAEILER